MRSFVCACLPACLYVCLFLSTCTSLLLVSPQPPPLLLMYMDEHMCNSSHFSHANNIQINIFIVLGLGPMPPKYATGLFHFRTTDRGNLFHSAQPMPCPFCQHVVSNDVITITTKSWHLYYLNIPMTKVNCKW